MSSELTARKTLRATLVADGASDHAILIPFLTLLLDQHQDSTYRIVRPVRQLQAFRDIESRINVFLTHRPR